MLSALQRLKNTVSKTTFRDDLAAVIARDGQHDRFYGLNGNFIRASLVVRLLRQSGVDSFVETGTGRGDTAFLAAAQSPLPVISCDSEAAACRRARLRLLPFRMRAKVEHADCREFLPKLAASGALRRPFFYLDAHTLDDIPLVEELSIILSSWRDFVVMVDDFQVPGQPAFHFYAWGEQIQGPGYVLDTLRSAPAPIAGWFPAYAPEAETGLRSGWMLLASESLAPSVRGLAGQGLLTEADFFAE